MKNNILTKSALEKLNMNGHTIIGRPFSDNQYRNILTFTKENLESPDTLFSQSSNEGSILIYSDASDITIGDFNIIAKHAGNIKKINFLFNEQSIISTITREYFDKNTVTGNRFQLVKSHFIEKKPEIIPFLPHFDRVRTLKFYMYLSDPKKTGGQLWIGKENWIKNSERIRDEYKYKNYKWLDIPANNASSYIGNYEPITCNTGDLIVFDSSQPHFHGTVKKGEHRLVFMLESQTFSEINFGYNDKLKKIVNQLQ